MRGVVKVGAGIVLAAILAPLLFVLSRNPDLVLPIWLVAAYFALRRVVAPARQPLVAPAALICGQLAFRVLQAFVVGLGALAERAPLFVVVPVALAAALAWLLLTGSRWAAVAVIAAEVGMLALEVRTIPGVMAQVQAQPFELLAFVMAAFIAPLVATGLVAAWLKPTPRLELTAEIVD